MFRTAVCHGSAAAKKKTVSIASTAKLPTSRAFWEKRNGGELSTISPLLMFTLWHQDTPAVQEVLKTGKGELFAYPLMEKLFCDAPPAEAKRFYLASRAVQRQLQQTTTHRRRNGFHMFISQEGAKPEYSQMGSLKRQIVALAKAWKKLPEAQRQMWKNKANATREYTPVEAKKIVKA